MTSTTLDPPTTAVFPATASTRAEPRDGVTRAAWIAVVGTVLFDAVGSGHGPAAFVGAADQALLVSIGLLALAAVTIAWLPRYARERAH